MMGDPSPQSIVAVGTRASHAREGPSGRVSRCESRAGNGEDRYDGRPVIPWSGGCSEGRGGASGKDRNTSQARATIHSVLRVTVEDSGSGHSGRAHSVSRMAWSLLGVQ